MEKQFQSLSNSQLEILKTFRHNLSEDNLKKIRKMISIFFAELAMDEADKVWEQEKWDKEKIDEMLNTKMRKRQ